MKCREGRAMLERVGCEAAEAQIDRFIEKRAREEADADRVEELWAASEARERERRRAVDAIRLGEEVRGE
jgi:hypothetical protein